MRAPPTRLLGQARHDRERQHRADEPRTVAGDYCHRPGHGGHRCAEQGGARGNRDEGEPPPGGDSPRVPDTTQEIRPIAAPATAQHPRRTCKRAEHAQQVQQPERGLLEGEPGCHRSPPDGPGPCEGECEERQDGRTRTHRIHRLRIAPAWGRRGAGLPDLRNVRDWVCRERADGQGPIPDVLQVRVVTNAERGTGSIRCPA
jgi:hypothetical protein